jgi:hypothetical protein
MRNKTKLGIPSLFRTFLETYVEFYNLVREPKYGYYMDASDVKEWLRVLKAARDTENPYLSNISALPNLLSIILEKERQLQDLKTRGYNPLTIQQKFKRAEMLEEYQSFYNFLCMESHSNRRALINRHANISNNDYDLAFYKNDPNEKYLQYMDSAAGLLVSATIDIHDHLESSARSQVDDLRQELEMVRSRYHEKD